MSEDGSSDDVVDQLDNSDLRSGVYEGGFKTWECSLDLASLLLDRGPRKDIDDLMRCDQIIEVAILRCTSLAVTDHRPARRRNSDTFTGVVPTRTAEQHTTHFRLCRLQ